jgi:hypothetical protein
MSPSSLVAFSRARREHFLDVVEMHTRSAFHTAVFYAQAYVGKLTEHSLERVLPRRSRSTSASPEMWDAWAEGINRRYAAKVGNA